MAQDTTPAIVCYQGDGSNSVFSVPFDKGYYGEVKVLFVRRGLADYTYYPDTYTVSGRLYAWALGPNYIYTHTPNPAVGAHTYNSEDVEQANDVTAAAGQTITVNSLIYTRAVQHDLANNLLLTWTGETLQLGDFICIIRDTERGQPYTMPNNQKHIENALDNLERQIQEVKDATDNALKVDPSYDIEDSHKMNPIDWLETIIRSTDKSVRALRYANDWLDYSLDDPNIADEDKTWNHLLNTENIKSIREQSYIVDGVTYYRTQYKASDGTWKTLADPHKWDNMKLTDLADTNITSPTNGQFIMFDGLKWKNVNSSATASWGTLIGDITDQTDLMNKFTEYVKTDGSSTMTGVLKMRASISFECAIAPYWHGVGFYKLNDDDSVTLMASMESDDGFLPGPTNTYDIGSSYHKWKNLYLAGKAYMSVINNGFDIAVPVTNSADTFALLSDIAFKSTDVELTTLASGQFLMYDGSKWINSTQGYANTDLSNLTSAGKANVSKQGTYDPNETYNTGTVGEAITGKANVALDNLTSAGKEVCANLAMPSSKIDSLTPVVSGGSYTAPADGYFSARATSTAAGNYFELMSSVIDSLVQSGSAGLDLSVFIPVQKGQIVTAYYSTNTPTFRFVYAQGAA